MIEEDFSFGTNFDNEEFSLSGNNLENEEYSLSGNQNNKKSTKVNSTQSINEIQKVYDTLNIKDKDLKLSWEDFFKQNAGIFILINKNYFQIPTKNDIDCFSINIEKWIHIAHKEWINVENQHKTELLTEALQAILKIYTKFLNSPEYAQYYIKEIKKNLAHHLHSVLEQKIKDGILELSEIQELYEIAVSIHLVTDSENGKKAILDCIKKAQEKKHFIIESFENTFLRRIAKKEKIERLNTESIKKNLFKEYKTLAELNSQVSSQKLTSDEDLYDEMDALLLENNILIPNTDFFISDFLEPEIERQKGHYDFSLPLNAQYYYYLKGTATNKYELTDEQWQELARERDIHLDSEFTVSFIMGYEKATKISDISKLIKDNPSIASERIMAGDLETYFSHIGRSDISEKIFNLKATHKLNQADIVSGVLNILNSQVSVTTDVEQMPAKLEENFDSLIENHASLKELVVFVVKNKHDEALINRIVSDEFVKNYLNINFTKFLLNILNELLLENDIKQYKFSFIRIAKAVQNFLASNEDFYTFLCVYDLLVQKAIQNGLINNSAIQINSDVLDNYLDSYIEEKKRMTSLYEKELEKLNNAKSNTKSVKKKKYTMFKRG